MNDILDAQKLEDRIRPILAGQHPGTQGATLACLLACYLAGHPEEVRGAVLEAHLATARQLIPLYEQLMKPYHEPRRRRRRKKQ